MKSIIIDIYENERKHNQYISILENENISSLKLPEEIANDTFILRRKSVEISTHSPRIALSSERIIEDIEKQGFAIHSTKINFDISNY